jgi:hypothetical protein
MGQESYLRGAALTWKNYRALSPEWEHEHCEFCFHKFLDPHYSPLHAQALSQEPENHSSAGYTNVEAPEVPAGKWWICETCFEHFRDEFGWSVVATDSDAWPYSTPEPKHRPTADDYDASRLVEGPNGRWLNRPDEAPKGRWLKPE